MCWSRLRKLSPPQDTTLCPVTTTGDLNAERISPAALKSPEEAQLELRREQGAWNSSQSWSVLGETPAEERNGQGRHLEARANGQT